MKSPFLLLFFIFSYTEILGQTTPKIDNIKSDSALFVITKTNGTEYIGKLLSDDGREVLIITEKLGKIFIQKSEIKSIVKINDAKDVVNGQYQPEGPFTTRHGFTTNALPIKKGENYAMINLFGPEVHFAVTNRLNVGLMSTWWLNPLALALKYTIPSNLPNVHFSVGTLLGTSGYLNHILGLHFANVTFGDRRKNLTVSAGYGYTSMLGGSTTSAFAITNGGPIFSIAGMAKVGAKTSFIFDSMLGLFQRNTTYLDPTMLTNNYALLLMPGMRFQTKENRAFQVSLVGLAFFDQVTIDPYPFPTCSWFFKF